MIKWFEKRYKQAKLTLCDVALIKWSVLFWTLFLVSLWPVLASLDWYWYLAAGIILMLRPMKKFLG